VSKYLLSGTGTTFRRVSSLDMPCTTLAVHYPPQHFPISSDFVLQGHSRTNDVGISAARRSTLSLTTRTLRPSCNLDASDPLHLVKPAFFHFTLLRESQTSVHMTSSPACRRRLSGELNLPLNALGLRSAKHSMRMSPTCRLRRVSERVAKVR
jgi:hypothetical protein